MSDRVLRMRELASIRGRKGLLPVSPATIWRWVKNGSFPPPFKLGEGVTCWDAAAVNKFVEQRAGGHHG